MKIFQPGRGKAEAQQFAGRKPQHFFICCSLLVVILTACGQSEDVQRVKKDAQPVENNAQSTAHPKAQFVFNLLKNELQRAEVWEAPKILGAAYRVRPTDMSLNFRFEILLNTPWNNDSQGVFLVTHANVEINPLFIRNLDAAIEQSVPQANDTHPRLQKTKQAFLKDQEGLKRILIESQIFRPASADS